MKKAMLCAVVFVAVSGTWAMAQYYGGAYVNNKASTVGESYARGMGDVMRSQGMANLANSEAAINMTEAARRDMENRDQWTDTYFQMRQKNREYRDAERRPRGTREDWIRIAQAGKPNRLSPSELDSVTGDIQWPKLLSTPTFATYRDQLEGLFAKRAAHGGADWNDTADIAALTKEMEAELKKLVSTVPPQEYMASKRFIESLAFENRQPAG